MHITMSYCKDEQCKMSPINCVYEFIHKLYQLPVFGELIHITPFISMD